MKVGDKVRVKGENVDGVISAVVDDDIFPYTVDFADGTWDTLAEHELALVEEAST